MAANKRNVVCWILPAAALLLCLPYIFAQDTGGIKDEDVRLVNGTYGAHMGRVEVRYNGTWGTICNRGWSYSDARAACKSLGYLTAVCVIRNPSFPLPTEPPPVWITNMLCPARADSIEECEYVGFGDESCPAIGGETICAERGIVGRTTELTAKEVRTHDVDLTWTLPPLPEGVVKVRFTIQVSPEEDNLTPDPTTTDVNITSFSHTLGGLTPNSSYTIRVRTDVQYSYCSSYLWGSYSSLIDIRTREFTRVSNISVRLVAPYPDVYFFGRVEVLYNNTWGTICDDQFRLPEAHVICSALKYEKALCFLPEAEYGPGSGPIWLDNVNCAPDDYLLDDCDFNDWGENNCRHVHDVSVVCQPTNFTDAVTGFSVVSTSPNSVDLSWDPFTFPPGTSVSRYLIRYRMPDDTSDRTYYVDAVNSRTTVNRIRYNTTVDFTIAAQYKMMNCRPFILAARSKPVTATTKERAPSGPPTSVHVLVLNSTAVEVQWNLPFFNMRNGVIRGFKIFVEEVASGSESMIDVADGDAEEYIVGDLEPGAVYTFSVLAYTGSDGPRSIHLTLTTYSEDYVELIVYFGVNGNGLDRITRRLGQRNLDVHCGSGIDGVIISWYYPDKTQVSYTDQYVRQGTNSAGVSVLQIGSGRGIGFCDAGVYVCKAVLTTGDTEVVQTRNFTVRVELSPPSPSVPFSVGVGNTWVNLGWNESSCDGGHDVTEFILRYQKVVPDYHVSSYAYVYGLSPSQRNYTVHSLESETSYKFSVQALSADFQPSDFSDERIIATLRDAPSAPRDVRARLVETPVVEVRWREPTSPNGIIVYYTVYASATTYFGYGLHLLFIDVISKEVAGHIGAVNITVDGDVPFLSNVDVSFQVSASVEVDGVENEGERSEITSDSTVFVPSANLPAPDNVKVIGSTNTSITISWDYPVKFFSAVAILGFKITYTADVDEVSPGGFLMQFMDSGAENVSSSSTSVTVTQLVPDTEYRFRVSAVTEDGQGPEIIVIGTTAAAKGAKFAYFQLKFPVANCYEYQIKDSLLDLIRDSITQTLVSTLCVSCGLPGITSDGLRCDRTAVGVAVYRGRIVGTDSTSADNFVTLLEAWVLSNTAMIELGSEISRVDPSCPTPLDSQNSAGCPVATTLAPPTMSTRPPSTAPSTGSVMSPEIVIHTESQRSGISQAQIGGLVIGVIIIVLLVLFVVLLIVLLVRSFCCRDSTVKMKKLNEEVVFTTPKFDQENELSHNNPYFGDSKEKDDLII